MKSVDDIASLPRRLVRRLRAVLYSNEVERELDDELRFHVDMETHYQRRRGLPHRDARAAAMSNFGGFERFKDEVRATRGVRPIEEFLTDSRLAARSLRSAPLYTLIALLTMAVGIGSATAVFSVLHGVMLRPLPYPEPHRIVSILERSRAHPRMPVAGANMDVLTATPAFQKVALYGSGMTSVHGDFESQRIRQTEMSPGFFEVLGVAPLHGRLPLYDEGADHAPKASVVSHRFWMNVMGADPGWEGRLLRTGYDEVVIVGIMPPDFDFPSNVDIWSAAENRIPSRTAHNWRSVARLAPGWSVDAARADLDARFATLKSELGNLVSAEGAHVESLHSALSGRSRRPLLLLMSAVTLVLCVACINLAGASLARAEGRRRELALRTVLGAERWRLVRQLLTEHLLLGLIGGAFGVVLAWMLIRILLGTAPETIPAFADVSIDLRVLAFALLVSMIAGLAVGLPPARTATRDLSGAMWSGPSATGTFGVRPRVLIAVEVALALTVLVGAGLLLRSLDLVLRQEPGFEVQRVVAADLMLPVFRYGSAEHPSGDPDSIRTFMERALAAVRDIPGVEAAGLINRVPLGAGGYATGIQREGETQFTDLAEYRVIDAGYFEAMGYDLLKGRGFHDDDNADAPHVAVITTSSATLFRDSEEVIGQRFRIPGMDPYADHVLTVVGVVDDVRHAGLDAHPSQVIFVPFMQRPDRLMSGASIVARASGDPGAIALPLRYRVRALDREIPVETTTLTTLRDRSVSARRFAAHVMAGFAVIAMFLAAVGTYGVLSHRVARRHTEIGIRRALGASRLDVRTLVLRDALSAVVPGVGLGLVLALLLSRLLGAMLYEVTPTDPLVFAVVTALLVVVAIAASWLPAQRAMHVDPVSAIRKD